MMLNTCHRSVTRSTSYAARRTLSVRAAAAGTGAPLKVVVTGAAGRTGSFVAKKLAAQPDKFEPRAVVRGEQSKSKVVGFGIKEDQVYFADVSSGQASAFAKAFQGADALILATSGVPKIKPFSLIKVFWAKLTGQKGVMPDFEWKDGQTPEQVDWLGAKAQFDAAKAAGIKHVIVVGSMGGTQADNSLNSLGNGNILKYKRKAEQYLMTLGVPYTIIHPGGLLDEKGGERQVIVDVDDKLLDRAVRNIPREDVAELCVQCLTLPEAKNRAFDCIALAPTEGTPTKDWAAVIASLKGANCDYSIHSQLDTAKV